MRADCFRIEIRIPFLTDISIVIIEFIHIRRSECLAAEELESSAFERAINQRCSWISVSLKNLVIIISYASTENRVVQYRELILKICSPRIRACRVVQILKKMIFIVITLLLHKIVVMLQTRYNLVFSKQLTGHLETSSPPFSGRAIPV